MIVNYYQGAPLPFALRTFASGDTPGAISTFNQQIAPIVFRNCSPCHRPGEAAPFSLLSYDDVKRHAAQIAEVTKRRYMPPWLPEPGHGEFAEERRLTDSEIQLIGDWARQGTPLGPTGHAPQPLHPAVERRRVVGHQGSLGCSVA